MAGSPPYRLADEARDARERLRPRPLAPGWRPGPVLQVYPKERRSPADPPRTTRRDMALVIAGGIAAGLGGIVGLALALAAGGPR